MVSGVYVGFGARSSGYFQNVPCRSFRRQRGSVVRLGVAGDAYYFAVVVYIYYIQGYTGVLHPKRLHLFLWENEQHSLIESQAVAKHQALFALLVRVGYFYVTRV